METWTLLNELVPALLLGTVVTIQVSVFALLVGLVLGLLVGVARVYGTPIIYWTATAYSTLLRAVPAVVILFILFFVVARFIELSPLIAGIFAVGIASSAYQAEIFRGAINSVSEAQMIAARAVGMSRFKAIRYIILPQAFRIVIPAWSNEAAQVLKNSSLVYVLGVPELLREAQYVAARTFEPFIVFGTAALIYLVLTVVTARGLDLLERRVKIPT
jgi:polar amino acid transport system permease protein